MSDQKQPHGGVDAGRRKFLSSSASTLGAATAAAMLPASIQRALAIPARSVTGTIQDVEHVVIFMQENRAFDHYYGVLRGVRGFNDRMAVTLPNGDPVWKQPGGLFGHVLPFKLDTKLTSGQFTKDLDHSWDGTHQAWNQGNWDQWVAAKSWITMGYYDREGLSYHYSLADSFTICDNYYCSVQGPTDPNRLYLWSGMIDPLGTGGGPVTGNDEAGYSWTTYPERLQAAGISWRVYQNPSNNAFTGNFDDNALAWFDQYRNAPADSPLHINGMSKWTLDDLRKDVVNGTLPQVSWIVAPAAFSEHPEWPPMFGGYYTSMVLDALTANANTWSKTVLLIMYDENDGYFDHLVAPTAPANAAQGASTVDTTAEFNPVDGLPIGLGPRVPLMAISPWSTGGYVCSQVFDHTSVIRFLETRFGVMEPNISAWRRSVCGDLTACFDFAHPDSSSPVPLMKDAPARIAKVTATRHLPAPQLSSSQFMPVQEPGTRPARPLPYALAVNGHESADGSGYEFDFANTGTTGAAFHLYDLQNGGAPKFYTVGAGDSLSATAAVASGSDYQYRVQGPNGTVRWFSGTLGNMHEPVVTLADNAVDGSVLVDVYNRGSSLITVEVKDMAYGGRTHSWLLPAGQHWKLPVGLDGSAQWYDLEVTVFGNRHYLQRFAGHVETGKVSTSDPANAG